MIIARPHSLSFTFLWGGVILCTPPIAKRPPTHCEMALSWAIILKRLVFTLLTL
jgi:hypothetical protein